MTSVTYDFDHDELDRYNSSYSSSPGNDKAYILAKIAYAALLASQPVHAEHVRATPWLLRVPAASSSYQETKISQNADSLASNQIATYGLENTNPEQNADIVQKQQLVELCNEIHGFESLSQGWDGEDAEQISKRAINGALSFVEFTPHKITFEAFPESDGSVGLQADTVEGRILLSFADDGTAAYLIRKNGAVHRGRGATNDTINKLLAIII